MRRLTRTKSGREIYGPKWQNMEASSSDAVHSASVKTTEIAQASDAAAPPAVTETNVVIVGDNEDQTQTLEGKDRKRSLSNCHESMYIATLRGDWVAAEMLLEENPKLASDEISEERERALHVAAAIKHRKFVKFLVQRMSPTDLELLDGHGYTACCYAAISGVVEIADFMIKKNSALARARDWENKTPLYKAALRGNAEMVSYFLKNIKVEELPMEEWFDLLIITIRRKMYELALEISKKNEQLATMTNDEGTALHLLARQSFIEINGLMWVRSVERQDIRSLAKKLWADIQRLGKASALELMKNPPILHDAAEVGNVELITMLTNTYPDLVWHTNSKGYTIFHIAVKYRHGNLFGLINEIGARKDLIAVSQDENGNNILHLAAELGPLELRILSMPLFKMQWEMLRFMKVMRIVPPVCMEMRNKEGHTPRELFSKAHEDLLRETRTWLRNTADSSMLISTLILSVLVASAFAVPGGYSTLGIPVLSKANWFTCFVIFEVLAMLFSAWSILNFFLSMMISSLKEEYFEVTIPNVYTRGLLAQCFSAIVGAAAFISAYFLVYAKPSPVFVNPVVIFVYLLLVSLILLQIFFLGARHPKRVIEKRTRHTLFNPV